MPSQHGVWLYNNEGLLPPSNQPRQQDEEHAIGSGDGWPVHLSLEDDELVAEKGVFREKLGLASAQVGEGGQRQGASRGKVKRVGEVSELSTTERSCTP